VLPILVWNVLGSSLGPATAVLIGFLRRMPGSVSLYIKTDNSDFHLQSTPNSLEFLSGRLMVSV
jgi:hypothetical protein